MSKENRTILQWLVHRRWRALLCAVALICLSIPTLAFGKSLNGTFLGTGTGREVSFNHHGKPLNDWAGTLKFKLDSGEQLLVFCIQIDVRVRSGDRYHSDGPVLALSNGCRIRYLLDKYPASTAKDADEAAARQMAIWVFSDNVDPATIGDAKVRDRTIALVNEATGKPCPKRRTEAPDLTIEPTTANADAGQVVAYTMHASSEDAGHPLTVSVSGPAVFSDASGANPGQQQQTINLNEQSEATVWVLITGAGQTNVSVALPYRLEAGTVYSQLDDNSPTQRLVMAESLDLVAKASAQLSGAAGAPPSAPSPPALTEQATAPAAPPPTKTPAPLSPTERPPNHRSTAVATAAATTEAQASPIAVTTEAQPGPPTVAEQQAPQQPIVAQGAAGGVAAQRPSKLPNTGGQASPTWLALGIAGFLLSVGWVVRRRGGHRQDRAR